MDAHRSAADAPSSGAHSQELTLVSFFGLLIQQWKIMLAVALCVSLPFTVYGLFMVSPAVQYTTLYQVAERDAYTPLRPIADTRQRIERVYSREAREALAVGFGVATGHPRETLQVSLRTEAPPGSQARVAEFHAHIISLLEASDRDRLTRRQAAWAQAASFSLHPSLDDTVTLNSSQEARMGETLLLAIEGDVPRLSNPWAWPVLGLMLSIILAVVAASSVSFAGAVARHLKASR